jgi:hypothetical protein
MIMTHVDLIEKLLKYAPLEQRFNNALQGRSEVRLLTVA